MYYLGRCEVSNKKIVTIRGMIGLCDCNNFFVSCERVFRPDLSREPVAVLSGNDGCIIARSNEVKALGIKMGVPLFQVKNIVQKHNVTLLSANHRLYADMSQRVMSTLKGLVPAIEIYSIDESFIDFEGYETDSLQQKAVEIARIIRRNTGIPVSIGIAPTKTLAKIASQLCKKYPKLNGACLMYRTEDIQKVLSKLPIGEVWGVGREYSKILNLAGVNSAYEFTLRSSDWVRSKLGIAGLRTWSELRSEPCIELDATTSTKKSISISRTFTKEMRTVDQLNSILTLFATTLSTKLRKQKSCASQITTYIYTNIHRENDPQRYETKTVNLNVPSDSTLEIIKIVSDSLNKIFLDGYGYKRAGITIAKLVPKDSVQGALFDEIDRNKHSNLMKSIDSLNSSFGDTTIQMATNSGAKLLGSGSLISPNYTTEWSEILKVKI